MSLTRRSENAPGLAAYCSIGETNRPALEYTSCMLNIDRTLSMTFGRPQTIPNQYINVDLPVDCRLEDLAATEAQSTDVNATNTVCFFNATL